MEPSWRNIKLILIWHEEMVEDNSSRIQQVLGKLGDLNQFVASLV